MKKIIVTVIAAVVLAASLGSAKADPTTPPFVYSVKFLCGLQTLGSQAFTPPKEPPVKPGNYATAVNVHNFHSSPNGVVFCKKAVVALPERVFPRGPVSRFKADKLEPNQALEVDCSDIVTLFAETPGTAPLPRFIKGFVEINSPVELSVTAVYTAQTCRDPQVIKLASDLPTSAAFISKPCRNLGELDLEVVPQRHFAGDGGLVCLSN
jgi:hypothetical protein